MGKKFSLIQVQSIVCCSGVSRSYCLGKSVSYIVLFSFFVLSSGEPVQEVYHKRSGENRDYLEEGGGIGGKRLV